MSGPGHEPTPRWPADRLEAALDGADVAARTFALLVDGPAWVHRRVETVEFIDDRTFRRRHSVHFTVPSVAPELRLDDTGPAYRLIPLTVLTKRRLINFDARDEELAALPVLTSQQNSVVSGRLLLMLAEQLLRQPPHPEVVEDLRLLASGDPREIEATLERWHSPTGDRPGDEHRAQLLAAPETNDFVHRLARNFIMLVLIDAPPGSQRVVKFAYDQPVTLASRESLQQRTATSLGWRAKEVTTDTPAVVDAQSYHFEVAVPDGVELVTTQLLTIEPGDDALRPVASDTLSRRRGGVVATDVEPGSTASVAFLLRAARRGWLTSCLFAAVATAVVLWLGTWRLNAFAGGNRATLTSPNLAATLLLAALGALSSLLVRTGEHALATTLLRRLRVLTVITITLPFIAAGTLVIGPAGTARTAIWVATAIVATAIAAVVAVSYRLPRVSSGPIGSDGQAASTAWAAEAVS